MRKVGDFMHRLVRPPLTPKSVAQFLASLSLGVFLLYAYDLAHQGPPTSYETMKEFDSAVVVGGRMTLWFKGFHATRVCPAFINVYLWSEETSPWGGLGKVFIPIERGSAQLSVTDPGDLGLSLTIPNNIPAKHYLVRINRQDNCSWLPFVDNTTISKSPDVVLAVGPSAARPDVVTAPSPKTPGAVAPAE